jgi:hypothetical protein
MNTISLNRALAGMEDIGVGQGVYEEIGQAL